MGGTQSPSHYTSTGPMSFPVGTPVTRPRSLPGGTLVTGPRSLPRGVLQSHTGGEYPCPRLGVLFVWGGGGQRHATQWLLFEPCIFINIKQSNVLWSGGNYEVL